MHVPYQEGLLLLKTNDWPLRRHGIKARFTHETERMWPLYFEHSHWWKKAELVQVRFTLCSRDHRSMWMQDGCKVYMDSYMASNGSIFMITWIIFQNHPLRVGLTQNRETTALRKFTTTDMLYYIICEEPICLETHWNSIRLRVWSHMASHYSWEPVRTLHDSGGALRRPWDTFFWVLTISWSWLLALGVRSRALHWVPIPMPMPTHTHGFWVGMGAILLFMGGHRFCASLYPTPNRSQTSRMHGIC